VSSASKRFLPAPPPACYRGSAKLTGGWQVLPGRLSACANRMPKPRRPDFGRLLPCQDRCAHPRRRATRRITSVRRSVLLPIGKITGQVGAADHPSRPSLRVDKMPLANCGHGRPVGWSTCYLLTEVIFSQILESRSDGSSYQIVKTADLGLNARQVLTIDQASRAPARNRPSRSPFSHCWRDCSGLCWRSAFGQAKASCHTSHGLGASRYLVLFAAKPLALKGYYQTPL
jgi:hypothetical protein